MPFDWTAPSYYPWRLKDGAASVVLTDDGWRWRILLRGRIVAAGVEATEQLARASADMCFDRMEGQVAPPHAAEGG